MKDFEKLTDQEVLNLTEVQISTYKRLRLAENGVKFIPEPKEPEKLEEKPEKTVYRIEGINIGFGYTGGNVVFESLEEAQKVADALQNCMSIGSKQSNSKIGYSNYYFEPGLDRDYNGSIKPLTVVTEKIFSKEHFMEISTNLQTYNKLYEQYKKDSEEYQKMLTRATELTADITQRILDIKVAQQRKESLLAKMKDDYLPLADGNKAIALNFMKKAYDISEDEEKYILENINHKEGQQ